MTGQVSVDRDLWERAEALFQEQSRTARTRGGITAPCLTCGAAAAD